MARDLGLGGVANTNGPRDFSGKEAAAVVTTNDGSGGPWMLMGRGSYIRMLLTLLLGGL